MLRNGDALRSGKRVADRGLKAETSRGHVSLGFLEEAQRGSDCQAFNHHSQFGLVIAYIPFIANSQSHGIITNARAIKKGRFKFPDLFVSTRVGQVQIPILRQYKSTISSMLSRGRWSHEDKKYLLRHNAPKSSDREQD